MQRNPVTVFFLVYQEVKFGKILQISQSEFLLWPDFSIFQFWWRLNISILSYNNMKTRETVRYASFVRHSKIMVCAYILYKNVLGVLVSSLMRDLLMIVSFEFMHFYNWLEFNFLFVFSVVRWHSLVYWLVIYKNTLYWIGFDQKVWPAIPRRAKMCGSRYPQWTVIKMVTYYFKNESKVI